MKTGTMILASLVLTTGLATRVAAHEDAKNPAVIERMKAMEAIGAGMDALVSMAKGEMAFDADKADQAVSTFIEKGMLAPGLFEANETDPATEALPAIWENWDDFVTKSENMVAVAKSIGSIPDEAALGPVLGKIGGTCKACHRDYRK